MSHSDITASQIIAIAPSAIAHKPQHSMDTLDDIERALTVAFKHKSMGTGKQTEKTIRSQTVFSERYKVLLAKYREISIAAQTDREAESVISEAVTNSYDDRDEFMMSGVLTRWPEMASSARTSTQQTVSRLSDRVTTEHVSQNP
jgi:hypothetical protein